MEKIKKMKVLHRDRYGIFRSMALLSALLVVLMGLNMYLHSNLDTLAAEERASDAARQISAQFQQMIEDSVSQMDVVAAYLNEGTDPQRALQVLSRNNAFAASAIFESGEITVSSGEIHLQDDILKTAAHMFGDVQALIIAQDDSAIQIRISLDENSELAAWISPDRVAQVLGRAYDEDYGYAVFNDDTGVYLINHTHFTEPGYYDALLVRNAASEIADLLNKPVAQAFVDADNTYGSYYIAQMPTEIESWSIALIIPQDLIDYNEGMPKGLYVFGLVTIAVSVAAVFVSGLFVRRRILRANRASRRENHLLNQLAELSAARGQVSMFLYKRREDVFDHYIDGFGNKRGSGDKCLTDLAAVAGFETGEAERLRTKCMEMESGTETEMNIHSHVNGIERFLRISLKCAADDQNIILGCIQDCTQGVITQNRIVDEQNYYSMMKPKSASIWQVNVTQNIWHISHCSDHRILKQLGIQLSSVRAYENDLQTTLRNQLHPEDYRAYAEEMSITGLMTMFRKGKIETVHEYRTLSGKDDAYEWHRQLVRVFQNPENHDIMANVFIINVDAEKNAEMERRERARMLQRSLTALGGLYKALFYVDLDHDICYTTKAPGGELISKFQSAFRVTMDAFIDQTVADEDRKALKDITSAYMLRKNLSETAHNQSIEYHRISGDRLKKTAMIIQAARFENGTVRDVVIAVRNIE